MKTDEEIGAMVVGDCESGTLTSIFAQHNRKEFTLKVVERELDHGVVEKRIYDEDGKLVDIRRVYPSGTVSNVRYIPRKPGAIGGHEH